MMDKNEILDYFNGKSEDSITEKLKNKIAELSEAIFQLKNAGIDVECDLRARVSHRGFEVPRLETFSCFGGGYLRIGSQKHIFAIVTNKAKDKTKQDCLELWVHALDSEPGGIKSFNRHDNLCFDMSSENWTTGLQKFIIDEFSLCVALHQMDHRNVFTYNQRQNDRYRGMNSIFEKARTVKKQTP